jgi:hypothetical protein
MNPSFVTKSSSFKVQNRKQPTCPTRPTLDRLQPKTGLNLPNEPDSVAQRARRTCEVVRQTIGLQPAGVGRPSGTESTRSIRRTRRMLWVGLSAVGNNKRIKTERKARNVIPKDKPHFRCPSEHSAHGLGPKMSWDSVVLLEKHGNL